MTHYISLDGCTWLKVKAKHYIIATRNGVKGKVTRN
jgi:hypothetical protein